MITTTDNTIPYTSNERELSGQIGVPTYTGTTWNGQFDLTYGSKEIYDGKQLNEYEEEVLLLL